MVYLRKMLKRGVFVRKSALVLSKELNKLNLNKENNGIFLYTYWCRVAYAKFEEWNKKEHSHSFWELHLCLSGTARILSGEKEHILNKNTYIFLAPKCKHTIIFESEDYSEFVWGFSIEEIKGVNENLCAMYETANVFNADTEMINSISRILENIEKTEFGYYNIIRNELYHIFVLLARKALVKDRETYIKAQKNEAELIKKYIRENLADSVSAKEVSSFFHISESSMERILKKEYDKSFSQIKREICAEAIRKFLLETDCTMEEIASETGFCDRYSMGKFFKKTEGATPGDYRKARRK